MLDQTGSAEYLLSGGVIHPWHMDQFGHMNVRWYAHFFDDASFLLLSRLGLHQAAVIKEFGVHCVTAQATTEFRAEVLAGACVDIFGSVSRIGGKSVTFEYRMTSAGTEVEHALCRSVEVFVDAKTHKSVTIPEGLRERLGTAQNATQ